MNHLSISKQITLLIVALGLWAFIVYIRFVAEPTALLFISAVHLDKAAHIAGGLFIAIGLEWRFRRARRAHRAAVAFGVAVAWEALELLFDADTKFFYANAPDLWRLDTIGDIVAGVLGAYGYRVFAWDRAKTPERASQR